MHDVEEVPTTNSSRMRAALRWVPSALWAAVIFRLSAIPGSQMPPGNYGSVAHVAVYAVLGALLFLAMEPGQGTSRAACLAILISSAYGVTDEFHQSFVPGRVPDVVDWGFDTLGAGIGAFASYVALRYVRRLRSGAKDSESGHSRD